MVRNLKRSLSILMAAIMLFSLLPMGVLAAGGHIEGFEKEDAAESYTISADASFVVVKQADSAFLFLRDALSDEEQAELESLIRAEDASLKDGFNEVIAADANGLAEYDGSAAPNIGRYVVDFSEGTVDVYNKNGVPDKSKISHLDYGAYVSGGGEPQIQPLSLRITGMKYLDGQPSQTEFSFYLKQVDTNGRDVSDPADVAVLPVVEESAVEARNDAQGRISFPEQTIETAGTYWYQVSEIIASADLQAGQYTYDESQFYIQVVVTEAQGQLQAQQSVYKASGDSVSDAQAIEFHNATVPAAADPDTASVIISGTKEIVQGGSATPPAETFRFSLKENEAEIASAQSAGGDFSFGAISYDRDDVGEHTYTVTETAGSAENWTYDGAVYTVTVTVADQEGVLNAAVTGILAGGEAAQKIVFTNTYTADESQPPQEPEPVDPPEPVEWDLSKSKEATNLDENFESQVTLSLPAADYKDDLDVVFVLDGSTSTDASGLAAAAADLLDSLAGYENLKVKVGVVIFGGFKPLLYSSDGLLPLSQDGNLETLKAVLTDKGYDKITGRSGSNLQAGVETARALLNSDSAVSEEDKYMIILSDGGARMWYNSETDSAMAKCYGGVDAGKFNTNQDFTDRYIDGTCQMRTFEMVMAGNPEDITRYAVNYKDLASNTTQVQGVQDDNYYTNLEMSTYVAAFSIAEASAESHVLWVDYPYQFDEFTQYTDSFKAWLADEGYVSRYDSRTMDTAELFSAVEDELIQLVDNGSKVVDVIGSGADYDFAFVNDISKLKLTVDGVELSKTQISETSYGFGGTGTNFDFAVTYYENGTTVQGKHYDECFVWDINVPVVKTATVQLTYAVRLTNPKTDAGTYGEYDRFGENHKAGLYTNNSATLFPVDSNNTPGAPEEFNKPTVDYTVEPDPGPGPGPSTTSLTVTKVWEDDGDQAQARPESITVTLLRDGQETSTYVLSDSNGWRHTFTGLSRSYDWSVAEADVPEGYVSQVTSVGSAWTITNTYEIADLEDPDVPQGELPDDPDAELPDEDVPQGELPDDPDGELPDEDVPLAEVPATGDSLLAWAAAAAVSGAGLVWLTGKKRKEEGED